MTEHVPSLRPLKAGEILDRAFQLYRANFTLFLGAVSLALMPLLLIELLGVYFHVAPYILQIFELLIRVNVVNGAMIWVAWCLYMGQPVSIFKAYWKALAHAVSLFVANLMLGLIYISAPVLVLGVMLFTGSVFSWLRASMSIPLSAGGAFRTFWDLLIGLLILLVLLAILFSGLVYAIFFYVRWGLNLPLIVIEEIGARDAFARSWSLTKEDFRRASAVMVSVSLLSYLVGVLPVYILNALTTSFISDNHGSFLSIFLLLLGAIISLPLTTSTLVVLYHDLIVRQEGYDLKMALGMMDEMFDTFDDDKILQSDR